jgi:hypothetical protein
MHEHAPNLVNLAPVLEYGLVEHVEEHALRVSTEHGIYAARRAKSCILAPTPGDAVLLCTDALGNCFILAVLTGAEESSTLAFQGDLRVQVRGGDLSLATDQELSCNAGRLHLSAPEAEARLGSVSLLAGLVRAQCRTLALVAETLEQSARSLTQRLGSLFRSVEEHAEVQAGSARYIVEDTLAVHTKNSVHIAEEDVKIDAEQIHLG